MPLTEPIVWVSLGHILSIFCFIWIAVEQIWPWVQDNQVRILIIFLTLILHSYTLICFIAARRGSFLLFKRTTSCTLSCPISSLKWWTADCNSTKSWHSLLARADDLRQLGRFFRDYTPPPEQVSRNSVLEIPPPPPPPPVKLVHNLMEVPQGSPLSPLSTSSDQGYLFLVVSSNQLTT